MIECLDRLVRVSMRIDYAKELGTLELNVWQLPTDESRAPHISDAFEFNTQGNTEFDEVSSAGN